MISKEVMDILKNKEITEIIPAELLEIQKPTLDVNSMVTMIATKAKRVNDLLVQVNNLKIYLRKRLNDPVVLYGDVIGIQNILIDKLEEVKNQSFDVAVLSVSCSNIFEENFEATIKELTEVKTKVKDERITLEKEKENLENKVRILEKQIIEGIDIPFDPKQLICMLEHYKMEKEGLEITKPTDLSKRMEEKKVKYDVLKHAGQLNKIYLEEGVKRGWIIRENEKYCLVNHMKKLAETILELQK